ncbi:MAG TPA: DUF1499 domain-containing protein [Candidatus Limnocylindria bacterium]|jgi:uncharacterized protein (DUF1499 family)|nr:DUF1499 domain-containing protein [Candidatus Limnocylindria bacterium]
MTPVCEDPVLPGKPRTSRWWILVRLPIICTVVVVVGLGVLSAMSNAPTLGATDGQLTPCPARPNCVCSMDPEAKSGPITPLAFTGDPTEALQRLKKAVLTLPRMRLIEESQGYLRFEATSRIFRFRDDVEFLLDEKAQVIHVRSASRVGYGDMGVNRARVEKIRAKFGS